MKKLILALLVLGVFLLGNRSDSLAQQQSAKVYWMSTVVVPLGKLQEYHAFAEKELVPVQEKNGYHYVAGWQTIIGDIEEVIAVAEFDNMDAYFKARASLLGSVEWKSLGAKIDALSRGIRTRMLTAVPYFKMK